MLYLAIDQHSKQLTVNVRDESGQVVQRKQVSTRSSAPWASTLRGDGTWRFQAGQTIRRGFWRHHISRRASTASRR